MEFYFYIQLGDLPTNKDSFIKILNGNMFCESDELYFFDKSGDKIIVENESLELLKGNEKNSKIKFLWKKRNDLSESIVHSFEEFNQKNSFSSNLVESVIISLSEAKKEETYEKELKTFNSYLNHLYENLDYNLSNDISPFEIINKLDKEYFKETNRSEVVDSFTSFVKKLDKIFIKLIDFKKNMETNNLKMIIHEEEMKKKLNKVLSENEEIQENSKKVSFYINEIEKLKGLLKIKDEKLIETDNRYQKLVENFKKEIEEINLNLVCLKEVNEKLSNEKNKLELNLNENNKELNNNILFSFCKYINEEVNFPNINENSLLNLIKAKAQSFTNKEKDKNDLKQIEMLLEKIENFIKRSYLPNDSILQNKLNNQQMIENENVELKKEISRLIVENETFKLKNSEVLKKLNDDETVIYLLNEKISDLKLEIKTANEMNTMYGSNKDVEIFLLNVKQKLISFYNIAINYCSMFKDENETKKKMKTNLDSCNKINDIFQCIDNLVFYLFETLKKLEEIDITKIYKLNVNLLEKYKVCNFCHDLKDISNINLLCEKHYICNSCIKIDEFDDCKNCGYKYYYYKY